MLAFCYNLKESYGQFAVPVERKIYQLEPLKMPFQFTQRPTRLFSSSFERWLAKVCKFWMNLTRRRAARGVFWGAGQVL